MKSFDFCIVGNLFVDTIQTLGVYETGVSNEGAGLQVDIGGAINTARSLLDLPGEQTVFLSSVVGNDEYGKLAINLLEQIKKDNSLFDYHVDKVPGLTTNALIISETNLQRRSSIVNWGVCREYEDFYIPEAKWYHFMYLDTLHGIKRKHFTDLPSDSIISADMCLASHTPSQRNNIMRLLEDVNYVVLSDDSAMSLADEKMEIYSSIVLDDKVKNAAVVHSPKGSCISEDGEQTMVYNKIIDNVDINVLGAGDAYAAKFMHVKSNGKHTTKESVVSAHKYATEFIMRDK